MPAKKFSLMPIEAYSLDSEYLVKDSTHTFVVARDDRNIIWTNYGGGWNDSRTRKLVASTSAYREWLMECIPCGKEDTNSGITFGVNGVCHTFANRELVFGNTAADVHSAEKDEYAVMFYGKYGLGIEQFKKIVTDSYNRLTGYDDRDAYNTVVGHISSYADDEFDSWKRFSTEVLHIDVESILRKDPAGGREVAKRRLNALITDREALYAKYCRGELNASQLRTSLKAAIVSNFKNYMDMLANIGFITQANAEQYTTRLDTLLNMYRSSMERDILSMQNDGLM